MAKRARKRRKPRPLDNTKVAKYERIIKQGDEMAERRYIWEALKKYREALNHYIIVRKPHATPAINVARKIAHFQSLLGRYDIAVNLLEPLCDPREADMGSKDGDLSVLLYDTSVAYQKLGEPDKAIEFAQRALVVCEHLLPASRGNMATTLAEMAVIELQRENHEAAEDYYQQALEHAVAIDRKSELVANIVSDMGGMFRKQKRFAEALAYWQRAMDIWHARFGPEHWQALIGLVHIGQIHRELGMVIEAEESLDRAREILNSLPPESDKQASELLLEVAKAFRREERDADALPLLEQALQRRERVYGKVARELIEVLHRIIEAQLRLYRPEDAEKTALRFLSVAQKTLPKNGVEYMQGIAALAQVYREMKQWDKALSMAEQVTPIAEKFFHPKSEQLAETYRQHALYLRELGRDAEAEPLEKRAAAIGPTTS